MTETDIQNLIKLEASRLGIRLWRNNVGALFDSNGRCLRYGLANDSASLNAVIKSSDLIGINWIYKNTDREKAQKAFIDLINSLGGDAMFCTGEGTL